MPSPPREPPRDRANSEAHAAAIVFDAVTVDIPGLRRHALEEVSLEVRSGRLFALIGPSGSGKSVLLKAACGLLPLAGGDVVLDGSSIGEAGDRALFDIRARVGMLFQQGALFDSLTVLENVVFPLLRRRWEGQSAHERARLELERVGLADAADLLPSELSGGMRKRVGIARALVADPPVALFDEPVAGLDPVTGARILRLVRAACDERGVTAMVVGHEIDTLIPACDEVGVLIEGRLEHVGPSSAVDAAEHPAVRQLVTGSLEGRL